MTRTWIVRLLLAATLVSSMAACGKSVTGLDGASKKAHDTIPWN